MTESSKTRELVKLTDAAIELRVSKSKLSRLAQRGEIYSEKYPFDERVTLVDIVELRTKFPASKRL